MACKSFVHSAEMLKNTSNLTQSFFRYNSVLAGNVTPRSNASFLRTQDVTVVPIRSKSIKNDSAEPHRVLAADRYTGERTSCHAVGTRFFRLRWGAWIRTIRGKDRDLEKKSPLKLYQSRQHVFCNAQQSRLLDKMAGPWYQKPHYYVDDPYEPYHDREEFLHSRRKPVPPS